MPLQGHRLAPQGACETGRVMDTHRTRKGGYEGAAPPYGNTGAQTALIDWLGVTFPEEVTLDSIYKFIGSDGWAGMERGAMGYRKGLVRGNVRILFDGAEGMGIHIEASGQGCRELEGDGMVLDWSIFLKNIIEAEGKFSRLDVAIDDRTGCLLMPNILACFNSGLIVSRYKTGRIMSGRKLNDASELGNTLYLGSPSSNTIIRIYDKAAENGEEGNHIRVELQTRNDRAYSLGTALAYLGFEEVPGIIRAYLDFKIRSSGSQRERWKTQGWWNMFLSGAKKLRLSTAPVVRSVDKSYQWISKQVAPTLAMVLRASGGDLGVFDQLISEGDKRLRPWHKALLASKNSP